VNLTKSKLKEIIKEVISEQRIDETIPAVAKEYKDLEKAETIYLKAISKLAAKVGKVDKKYQKEVSGLAKYVMSPMKKFKELLSKEILDKLQ
tara:strand:- start:99 stop:374 length:276 start_codon:yes stop_codon:yes gene_type:complete